MQFKVTATIERSMASGNNKNGAWALYLVKEASQAKYQKSWTMFSSAPLTIGATYDLEGYITESPSKKYKDESGKAAYQTTYNLTKYLQVGNNQQKQPDFSDINNMSEPVFNTEDSIPF